MRTNVAVRIRKAMLTNERALLATIRRSNKDGELWRETHMLSVASWNALERLQAKGKVVYARRKWVGGYKVVGFAGKLQ